MSHHGPSILTEIGVGHGDLPNSNSNNIEEEKASEQEGHQQDAAKANQPRNKGFEM